MQPAWRLPRPELGPAQAASARPKPNAEDDTPEGPPRKKAAVESGKQDLPKGKKRRAAKKSEEKTDESDWVQATQQLAKLTLANAQMIRSLVGCVLTTYICESSKDFIGAAEEEGKAYAQIVKEEGAGHARGAPHPYVLWACLEKWTEDEEFKGRHAKEFEVLTQLREAAQEDVQVLADPVMYFRVKPTYRGDKEDKATHKVTWAIAPNSTLYGTTAAPFGAQQLHQALCRAVEAAGATRKLGQPPKPEVERAVERMLARISR